MDSARVEFLLKEIQKAERTEKELWDFLDPPVSPYGNTSSVANNLRGMSGASGCNRNRKCPYRTAQVKLKSLPVALLTANRFLEASSERRAAKTARRLR